MAPSNLAVLTKSHKIIAQKRRAKKDQIKEVVFDEDARRDFLTGFHKRKLQKKEAAKQKALHREKEERLEARRENRRMLAERAAKNAVEVEKAYGATVDDEDSDKWDGFSEPSGSGKGKRTADENEEEYEGEEQLATVIVVEDFDPDELLHGPKQINAIDGDGGGDVAQSTRPEPISKAKLETAKVKAATTTKKLQSKDSKKIKYQTNAARKVERVKQQKRKVEKAQRAGGKGSRKKSGKR